MLNRAYRLFVLFVAAGGIASQAAIYTWTEPGPPIRSDAISYYVYLPSVVLGGSPRLWATADDQYGGEYPHYTGLRRWPNTSWWLNPHPIGVAVMMLPWFMAAHVLTLWSNLPPDGFSLYYQAAASLSGLGYGLLGLLVLGRTLSATHSPGVVVATLGTLTFGTNLFHYMTRDAGYSHAYGFTLVAVLVAITPAWLSAPTRARSAVLGAVVGLLFLVRHTHLLFVAIPLLHGVGTTASVRSRLAALWNARTSVLLAGAVAAAVAAPQMALYKAVTSHWLVSPYALVEGASTFHTPRVLDVLFSPTKGWFFWTPLALLALAGLASRARTVSAWRWPAVVCLVPLTLLIGGWHDWQFGGSFGHRGFTDALPLLAWPMAGMFAWIARGGRPQFALGAVIAALTALNCFQMLQYWRGLIPYQDTTWAHYVSIFLRWTP